MLIQHKYIRSSIMTWIIRQGLTMLWNTGYYIYESCTLHLPTSMYNYYSTSTGIQILLTPGAM